MPRTTVSAMAVMRDATLHDLPGVYRVCLLTGNAGGDASATSTDPDLLGHVWAGPYLLFPEAVALVVHDDEGVAGYCLGVPDTAAFERWVEQVWQPPLRERHPRGSGRGSDAGLVERLHAPTHTDEELLAAHPAHLHVDLLPRLQGRGAGRRLVEAMTARLCAAGAPGIHVGVDTANTRAVAFYERLGFTEIGRPDEDTLLYGRDLRT